MNFEEFRTQYGPARAVPPERVGHIDECRAMTTEDGLLLWEARAGEAPPLGNTPTIDADVLRQRCLWVIETERIPYAFELCHFAQQLDPIMCGKIKHSNLTGGGPAFSGGELLFLDDATIIINGCSGRYGPRSGEELMRVAEAFCGTGYGVWSMGWDTEADRPTPFLLGLSPEWIAR